MPPPPKKFDGSADDVVDMAVQEMGKRLQDSAEGLPAHVLIKLVAEAEKTAARRAAAKEREELAEVRRDELDVIMESALSSEKKRALLEAVLERRKKGVEQVTDLLQGDI